MSDIAILVVSCDKYRDLWVPCIKSIQRNWPGLEVPLYVVSNEESAILPVGRVLKTGPDKGWSDALMSALNEIHEDILIVLMDDMYLSWIDVAELLSGADLIRTKQFGHLHLRPVPAVGVANDSSFWNPYPKLMPYSANVVGLWDRRVLTNVLLSQETPWEFEVMGSYRLCRISLAGFPRRAVVTYRHLVVRGKWSSELREIDFEHFGLNRGIRRRSRVPLPVTRATESLYGSVISRVPYHWRLNAMNRFRKLFAAY